MGSSAQDCRGAAAAERQYPLTCSLYPPLVKSRKRTGLQPRSRITADKRRQAPTPRLRCGTSNTSNTACVLMRSMPSSPMVPRNRSSGSRYGSGSPPGACTFASCISSHHDRTVSLPVRPGHLSRVTSDEHFSIPQKLTGGWWQMLPAECPANNGVQYREGPSCPWSE